MSFYRDHVYPHLVNALGDPPPIQEIRRRIVPLATGKVLEIGVGTGVNFTLYDSYRVSKLYALEPNPGMIRLAKSNKPCSADHR
jgi:16S rRNA A1518/A1519 N6-dimethyltransferase RsmA/KsgA/DIM1 with predicted DNA glycosylase/AP lyase activity